MPLPRHNAVVFSAFVLCALALPACSEQADKNYPVSGVVTLDGAPIREGSITFRPVDPNQRPESADIHDGEFALKLPAGKVRVEVRATRPSSGPPVAGMGPAMEDYIPDKYKGPGTTLQADVTTAGPNRLEFPLVTDKGKK